jgi:CDP-diacylglycerol---serine O-phosphatidyltransferase
MDPIVPQLEKDIRRRRRRRLFGPSRIPVRMMVPNFVTLFGLCAGLTSIRMSIEGRWELALAAIVFAACLDGLDGRVARLLRASSRFGAELDSLADFVNFGVAPAILIFTWGLGDLKSLGWICVLIFALASALRLARFNVALDEDRPKWQSNYFSGMPTPAAAIAVLLPLYLDNLGLELRSIPWAMNVALVYTVAIAVMMVSAVPTYSGKLLGERIHSEWVLPTFMAAVGLVALLVTYPYGTLTLVTLGYLALIPLSWMRYRRLSNEPQDDDAFQSVSPPEASRSEESQADAETSAATGQDDKRHPAGPSADVVDIHRKT